MVTCSTSASCYDNEIEWLCGGVDALSCRYICILSISRTPGVLRWQWRMETVRGEFPACFWIKTKTQFIQSCTISTFFSLCVNIFSQKTVCGHSAPLEIRPSSLKQLSKVGRGHTLYSTSKQKWSMIIDKFESQRPFVTKGRDFGSHQCRENCLDAIFRLQRVSF